MNNAILYTALLCIFHSTVFAQKDSLLIKKIEKTKINYKAYVLSGDDLFALNDSGRLVIWDLKKQDTISFLHNNPAEFYTAIAKDKNNDIFIGARNGDIFKIDPATLSYSLYLKAKYTIRYMCFNSQNKLFLIVHNAVYDPVTKRYWNKFENHANGLIVTKKSFFFFRKRLTKYFSMPQYTFLDDNDRWWMTATHGEFGSDVQLFDTRYEKILDNRFGNLRPGSLSPRSVFEDTQGNIYITCGLQHFMNWGEIYRIRKDSIVTKIFDGHIKPDSVIVNGAKIENDFGKEFVGPGAYSKTDNCLYFATSTGFYKAAITGDKLMPRFLFNTAFSASSEPLAIGAAMWILKLDFTADNKLLFLTENDGFGIYDGKTLVQLK